MPRRGWVEHGLEYITFYDQKHISPLVALFPAGSRRTARGAHICETPLLHRGLIPQRLSSDILVPNKIGLEGSSQITSAYASHFIFELELEWCRWKFSGL